MSMNSEIRGANLCIISAFGRDVVGLVGLLTSMIAEAGGNIVDIVEHVTHGYFSIFMVVDLQQAAIPGEQLAQRLRCTAQQTGLHLVMDYSNGNLTTQMSANLMLMVVLGPDQPGIVAKLAFLLGNCGINLEQIRMIARGDLFAMEMLTDTGNCARQLTQVREEITQAMQALGMGVVFQTENVYTRAKRLIVFDVDGDAFAFSCATAGNFKLVDGHGSPTPPNALLQQLAGECRVGGGSVELVRTLHAMGYRVALLSRGLAPFTAALGAQLDADYIHSGIVSPAELQQLVADICRRESLQPDEAVIIGQPGRSTTLATGLKFFYQGGLLATALADGRLTDEQAAGIANQFKLR